MRTSRIEFLWAEALPTKLVSAVTALLSKEDPLLTRAATTFLRHTARHRHFLRRLDYSATYKEVRDWSGRDFRTLTRNEMKRATYAARLLKAYEQTYEYLNDSFFSLAAIGFLASGATRADILAILKDQTWAMRHEVLTRWGWVGEHRRLLKQGESLQAPYTCTVAGRGHFERGLDREFYALLLFLHSLRAQTGQELLFAAKQETPDFVLEDEEGKRIGVEMTEASVSDAWDKERDAEKRVLDVVKVSAEPLPLHVHILEPNSWLPLLDRLTAVEHWWKVQLELIGLPLKKTTIKNQELELAIQLSPAPRFSLSWSDPRGKTGTDIQRESLQLQATLRERIQKKIVKNGKLRRQPSVRPCYLVVYPNHDLGQDLEEAVKEFFKHPPVDVQSHFDGVWLSNETWLAKLC